MRTAVWSIFAVAFAVWSLIAWGAHALIGAGGSLVAGNADVVPVWPEAVEPLSWLAHFGTGVGEWLVVAIWALVSGAMALAAYLVTRLLPGSAQHIKQLGSNLNVHR
jgi:hypothetical protein